MKIRKVFIKEYKVFRDFEINFCDKNDNPLDIIVIAGINGSGKTTLFEFIFNMFNIGFEDDKNLVQIADNKIPRDNDIFDLQGNRESNYYFWDMNGNYELAEYEKNIIEKINYLKIEKIDIQNTKEKIIEYIDKLIFEDEINPKEAYIKVQNILNSIFNDFKLQVDFKGLDRKKEVFFKNNFNDKIKIDDLSTGEKELITKAFSLYLADIKDSVILIDEPETSLHPSWQNRILSVYEMIAKEKNNQIIIATHSPQIIASAKRESLRILTKNRDKIEVVSDFEGSYGWKFSKVLTDIMEVENLRTPLVDKKLDKLKELISEDRYESEEFNELKDELENLLGFEDIDLSLTRLEVLRRKKAKNA